MEAPSTLTMQHLIARLQAGQVFRVSINEDFVVSGGIVYELSFRDGKFCLRQGEVDLGSFNQAWTALFTLLSCIGDFVTPTQQYALTQKGNIRAALIIIEDIVQQREISQLDSQERAQIGGHARSMLTALGNNKEISSHSVGKGLVGILSEINSMLYIADNRQRELDSLEVHVLIDLASALVLLMQDGKM